MRWIVILFAVILSTAASAGSLQDKDGTWWTTIEPPIRWLAKPGLKPQVSYLPRDVAFGACKLSTGKSDQFGCANLWPERCVVIVVDDLPPPLRAAVLKHELAHCRGWPADHPLD